MAPCRGVLHLTVLLCCSYSLLANFSVPSAITKTSWTNNPSDCPQAEFEDGSAVRFVDTRKTNDPHDIGFGFYCNGSCTSFLLAVFLYSLNDGMGSPQVVWSANRNNPVGENSTLDLTQQGGLILREADGSSVWSTDISGKSVVELNVMPTGNLALVDASTDIIWQSFDHPTDTLVLGQKLIWRQKLKGNVSPVDSREGNLYYFTVTREGIAAFIQSDPPLSYFEREFGGEGHNPKPYAKFSNGSLECFIDSAEPDPANGGLLLPRASTIQYMKLCSDGHMRIYEWKRGWEVVFDVYHNFDYGECEYPLVCGKYGICTNGSQCVCPGGSENGKTYLTPVDSKLPNLGCLETTPFSCDAPQDHFFLDLKNVTYINLENSFKTDIEMCKRICMLNCSCRAAFFEYRKSDIHGDCSLHSEIFSLINYNETTRTRFAFLKMQNTTNASNPRVAKPFSTRSLMFFLIALFIILSITVYMKKKDDIEEDENCLDQVSGILSRFSYKDLKFLTGNFCTKLGEGAFGSVFEGVLPNGVKVAVKHLDGLRNVNKSFLTEVETIGCIHHVNLVSLVGYCADKSRRLLVYEYMSNGSLDKWVYCKNQDVTLDWKTRKKVILDVARGLAYLHEECEQTIIHLDIKPQNILLDSKFNAKVSDFGLSKLTNRDHSGTMTTMRGTRGYLAPEWQSSVITEKVDVFSFGIVVLEMCCGRRNLDFSEPEERMHLLSLLEKYAKEGRLGDMIDANCPDMRLHREEVAEMMKVAEWCLQSEYSERPSMSVVVKVLEGVMDIKENLNYNFSSTLPPCTATGRESVSTMLLSSSVLSGPR